MDPIHPIAPGPPAIPRAAVPPVERLKRISRERDRPPKDSHQRERRESADGDGDEGEDDGRPHIDVRA
jgi:hypothetical protein